ncbi:MAG TPA: MMPL family transporter, partial [Bacillota bacterium]
LLFQVGATVAMGVLVDTFLIRAVLIPALASSLGRWNWWPGGRERPAARPDR